MFLAILPITSQSQLLQPAYKVFCSVVQIQSSRCTAYQIQTQNSFPFLWISDIFYGSMWILWLQRDSDWNLGELQLNCRGKYWTVSWRCAYKSVLHCQKKICIFKTQTLFCPIVVFCNCSALLSQWHYTAEITTSESQYEAEFWCIRQVFLQSSQKMKIIWALRDNLVQTLAVTAESFAYITLFPHRWLCLSSLSQRTCPLSHLLHWRQVGLNLKSVTVPNMSLTELNRVIIAFTVSSQQDSVAKKDT